MFVKFDSMDVLVVGASVRAASASLRRVGWRPVAVDLFGDVDLASTCQSIRIAPADYPSKIWERVSLLRPMPWIYTGAIENHPEVVQAISRRFRLLGNPSEVLSLVRDPFRVAEVVRRAGFLAPEVRPSSQRLPTDGSWLEKPVASGGGEGIKPWLSLDSTRTDPVYYQRKVGGLSLSATFVRGGSETRLVGVTRQYHGRAGNLFAYRGSLGPWPLPESTRREVEGLGRAVGDSFGLLGLFGVDLIVDGDRPWLIEVNPRYTASVEVLEAALGRSLMADHIQAFAERIEPTPAVDPARFVGKAILFAQSKECLTDLIPIETFDDGMPRIADVPRPGTHFEVGQPVMTVFGRGETWEACRVDLAKRLKAWKTRIEVLRSKSNLGVDDQKQGHRDEQDSQDHPREPERLDRDFPPGFMPRRRINAAHGHHERQDEPVGGEGAGVDHGPSFHA